MFERVYCVLLTKHHITDGIESIVECRHNSEQLLVNQKVWLTVDLLMLPFHVIRHKNMHRCSPTHHTIKVPDNN